MKKFVFALLGALVMVATPATANASAASDAIVIFNQVNEERAEAGLHELAWSNDLKECAQVRSEEASRVWSHTRPNGQRFNTVNKKVQGGENLAYCSEEAVEDIVVDEWMNSPTHKDNILFEEFENAAVYTYTTGGTTYVALEFGY